MADSSRTATSLGQLRTNVASRITEGLLSSNGKVAALGLLMAVVTLSFTIWIQLELREQANTRGPLAQAAVGLDTAINESSASLSGWVAYGSPHFVIDRRRIWFEQIEVALDRLEALSIGRRHKEVALEVEELEFSLRELARVQWAIEDVAQTPGNLPATVTYQTRLEPLRRSILLHSRNLIFRLSAERGGESASELVMLLASFRSSFIQAELALSELLAEFSEVRENEVNDHLARSDEFVAEILRKSQDGAAGNLDDRIEFWAQELKAYRTQIPEVLALRRSPSWNVAQSLYDNEAAPAAQRALAISERLAVKQAQLSAEHADSLVEVGYFVIAVAFLMGLASAASLWVSFRLRQQVENVLARAKKLGQYVLDRRLGRGGMGEVYLGHHAMLLRPTAIKLLRPNSALDLRAQRRFQAEVQATSQLSHPNTVEIFDYGRSPEGAFYYAMEYLEGFTLQTLVERTGPVDPRRVAHVLTQACGSLREAHSRGLVHRDIKPSNIMMTERGGVYDVVKILDFGLVKDIATDSGETDAVNAMAGTPMYLAPESILATDGATPQADLYALGAVAYFMLTGTTVFPSGPMVEVLERHLNEVPVFPSQRLERPLPADLEYVVMACLAKDPAERPGSAGKLEEMLRACNVEDWTPADATTWWDEYGEAVCNELVNRDPIDATASRLEVDFGAGRSAGR